MPHPLHFRRALDDKYNNDNASSSHCSQDDDGESSYSSDYSSFWGRDYDDDGDIEEVV